jgi:surfeit locus 1 family protein
MKKTEFTHYRFSFMPTLLGTILTIICIPLFIKFGLWQYNKAQLKLSIQAAYNQAEVGAALDFPLQVIDVEAWNYKKITVTGVYAPKYQFLLDNQVEGNRVGFNVITPLKIDQSSQYVLVNRGWILGKDTHTELPQFNTPTSQQTLTGQVWVPSKKIFTLENKKPAIGSNLIAAVWQHMDMELYRRTVPFEVSPIAIKLDVNSDAGGFVRNWQVPPERIATHIGYAYQWFGFALATLLIYLYMSVKIVKPNEEI